MKVAIRADASLVIGTGHIMRCLTLANAMRQAGHELIFICRNYDGNMIKFLSDTGYNVLELEAPPRRPGTDDWFGITQEADCTEAIEVLPEGIDLIVVDHYGFDESSESRLRKHVRKIMVIDDLANRPHNCDLLLDQNLVEKIHERYRRLADSATLLLGPDFALVRPEFRTHRDFSLARRAAGELGSCLVFMGGSDPSDDTRKALGGILDSGRTWKRIDVVIGASYQHVQALEDKCRKLPEVRLHIQTQHMAELMMEADLAITAGGSVSWEKCVLGVPSLAVVQADNQAAIVSKLAAVGALVNLGDAKGLGSEAYSAALARLTGDRLKALSAAAALVCDGAGTTRVLDAIDNTVYG